MRKYFTAFNSTQTQACGHSYIWVCTIYVRVCKFTVYMHMHKCELCQCLHSFSLILEYVNLVSKKHMH